MGTATGDAAAVQQRGDPRPGGLVGASTLELVEELTRAKHLLDHAAHRQSQQLAETEGSGRARAIVVELCRRRMPVGGRAAGTSPPRHPGQGPQAP